MRTIKFRLRLENLVIGYERILPNEDGYLHSEWNRKNDEDWHSDSTNPLPRHTAKDEFTGLLDKNGKEIYEDDKVIADGKNGVVQWNESEAFYWVRFGENKFNYLHNVIDIEVIGNIYESPELLALTGERSN